MKRPFARLPGLIAAAALLLTATACGDDGGDAGTSAEGGEAAAEGFDRQSPGDDLLDTARWGGELPGDTVKASWRFPETYETTGEAPNNEATLSDGGTDYRISITPSPGRDQAAAQADDFAMQARADGQDVEQEELSIDGRTFIVVSQEDGGQSRRTFYHSPQGGANHYLVVFFAGTGLDDTPEERLEEVYQTVASLQVEAVD